MARIFTRLFVLAKMYCVLTSASWVNGGTLTGSFTPVPQGTNVDLAAEGPIDWVHWGLVTETSVNRKAMVPPQIGNFKLVDASNGFAYVYQYADNYNGYSWRDGNQVVSVTNTPTGVWAYGTPNIGSGFEITVPADTSVKTLKVFVGTFAARGRFTAALSDSSATGYTNSALLNMGNGPGGVYTIDYAANSAGQSLMVRWTLTQTFRPDGNVTLQAAALTEANANNPPFARITIPTNSTAHPAGETLTISVDAFDADGTVATVEFFVGETKLGEDTTEPYSFDWAGVPAGRHLVMARVTDNAGGVRYSAPVELFAHTAGGTLTGTVALPPTGVDLTFEGTLDWIHWGLLNADSFNRKANVTPRINNFTKIGTNAVKQLQDSFTAYDWSDGTPVAATNSTRTGVYILGVTNGFTFSVPADTSQRTLKVYVGLYGVRGLFRAYLSDFSAPVYADASLDNIFGNAYGVYTLNYAAASAGQGLTVQYTAQRTYDEVYGNVTLQAASLSGGSTPTNTPPTVIIASPTNNATFIATANIAIAADASDSDGISNVEFFAGATKIGEASNAPYSVVWGNVAAGSYTLTVKATDNLGAVTTSSPVNISVVNGTPSAVSIVNTAINGNQLTFSFATETNRGYTIEFTDSLNPVNWQTLTNIAGSGSTLTVTNQTAPTSQRFYRVVTK